MSILRTAALVVLFSVAAHAALWDGGGADDAFSTPQNWLGDTTPPNDGTESLTFPDHGDGLRTCVVDAPWSVRGIYGDPAFSSGAYLFTGQTLSVGGSGINPSLFSDLRFRTPLVLTAFQTWHLTGSLVLEDQVTMAGPLTLTGGGPATFVGPLTGNSGLTIAGGSRTVTLAGDNSTWLGPCVITHGTLALDTGTGYAIQNGVEVDGSSLTSPAPVLRWQAPHQFAPGAALTLRTGATALLQGHSDTIHDLVLTGGTLDLGGGALTITGDLVSSPSPDAGVVAGALAFSPGPHGLDVQPGAGPALTMDGLHGLDPNVQCSKIGYGTLRWDGASEFAGAFDVELGLLEVTTPVGFASAGVLLDLGYVGALHVDTGNAESGLAVRGLELDSMDQLVLFSGRLRFDGGAMAFPGTSLTLGMPGTAASYPAVELSGGAEGTIQYGTVLGAMAGTKALLAVTGDDGTTPSTYRNTGGGGGADLTVGLAGKGLLHVSDGGLVRINDDILIADDPGSLGELVIHGMGAAPSTVQAVGSGSVVQVGREGDGRAEIRDGGRLESRFDLNVGAVAGMGEVALIRTAGAPAPVLSVGDDLTLGGSEADEGGTGVLTSDGGVVEVADLLLVWYGGALDVDGGALRAGRLRDHPSAVFLRNAEISVDLFEQSTDLDRCTLSPGDGVGSTTVQGDLNLYQGGMVFDVAAAGHDMLTVSGALEPGGADVVFRFLDGHVPAPGDSLTVISAGTLGTDLGDVSVEGAPAGFQYSLAMDGTSLTLVAERIVSVDDAAPALLSLHGNHPNPFNPSTTFTFAVPRRGVVTLDVFDAAGRRVRRLLQDTLDPGEHAARWDGRDDRGRVLASGVYLARLRGNDAEAVRRVTLTR